MSLLIKALKRAEQKHDEARLASTNSTSTESADHTDLEIGLQAVDTDDTELALELAQMQLDQSSTPESQRTDSQDSISLSQPGPFINSNDAQAISSPLPTLENLPASNQAPESREPRLDHSSDAVKTSVISTKPALELEGLGIPRNSSNQGITQSNPSSAPAKAAAGSPISSTSNNHAGTAYRSADATANKTSRPWSPADATRTTSRVLVYSMLALAVAACVGWLGLNLLGFSFSKNSPRPASMPVSVPSAGSLPAPTPTDQVAQSASTASDRFESAPDEQSSRPTNTPKPPGSTSNAKVLRPAAERALTGSNNGAKRESTNNVSAEKSATAASTPTQLPNPASPNPASPGPSAEIPSGTPAGVRLSRSESFAEQTLKLNERAWQLLSRNEQAGARNIYEEVLRLDRNNSDAWLGLATIAAKLGDPASADLHYRKALEIDPNDVAAKAGLLSLRSNHEPNTHESRLRHLLEQGGGQPALLFALGNTLASQARWADAQQAYFAAYTADQGNADYAFNLAVTLERLRQPQAAANHYRKALELAERRPAQFDRSVAQRRLTALQTPAVQSPGAANPAADPE